MDYKKGDFFLIKDETYKAKYFIGEIDEKVNDGYLLYVYIFPEDTEDGKQSYMSSFEVFLTTNQKMCLLDGTKEEKVEVVSLEEYINRKYKNLDEKSVPLYFKRQNYYIERNLFVPGELPRICICQQIFNPDNPFVFKSGEIFHDECLIQAGLDIPEFPEEPIIQNNLFDINDINLLNKKREIKERYRPKKLSDKKSKDEDKSEEEEEKEEEEKEEEEKEEEEKDIEERFKEERLIFETLKKGFSTIAKNKSYLDKYIKYQDKEIYKLIKNDDIDRANVDLRNLATKIRRIMYDFYSKTPKNYSFFLKEFIKEKEISINLLIKIIIIGEIDPEQILMDLTTNGINRIILRQKLDGTWEADKKNMEDLNIGCNDLNEFKNKNKDILNDELFGKKDIKEIDDKTLMTIIIICYLEKNIKDKEILKITLDKAKDAVRKVVDNFDDKLVEKLIQKIFAEDK